MVCNCECLRYLNYKLEYKLAHVHTHRAIKNSHLFRLFYVLVDIHGVLIELSNLIVLPFILENFIAFDYVWCMRC